MADKQPTRTPSATLSPAAECWWERIGDCTYLVMNAVDTIGKKVRLEMTLDEAMRFACLLNDPEWWVDAAQLNPKSHKTKEKNNG